jgi:hypothetical protein
MGDERLDLSLLGLLFQDRNGFPGENVAHGALCPIRSIPLPVSTQIEGGCREVRRHG